MNVIKYNGHVICVQLDRRDLETLIDKLNDPESSKTIGSDVLVKAVENDERDIEVTAPPADKREWDPFRAERYR